MNVKEKIAISKQEDSLTLHQEGMFYKCYNEDAMVFVQKIKPYKVLSKFIKNAGEEVLSIGFPVSELKKSTKGFLPPRMTIAERDAIVSPAVGLLIWCTDCGTTGAINIYNGTIWASITAVPDIPTIGTVIGGIGQADR